VAASAARRSAGSSCGVRQGWRRLLTRLCGLPGGVVDGDEPDVGLRDDANIVTPVEPLPLPDHVAGAALFLTAVDLDHEHASHHEQKPAARMLGVDDDVP